MLSECAFSSGGLTGTVLCNHLAVEAFEGLQILKSAYWNGHLTAAEQARGHIFALLQTQDAVDIEEDEPDIL